MVTLAEAKVHLRITHDDDDESITAMIGAAVAHLASIGVDTESDPMPAPVHQAALRLVGRMFDTRGGETELAEDPFVDRLVAPFREIAL